MIRMLIVGYCFAIRSERRLCEEVHLNLAYRWFCRLGLDGRVPDHSTFSLNRNGRFRESNILRHVFETVVRRCMAEGLVGGEGFAVDASLIQADANKQRSIPGDEWNVDAIEPMPFRPFAIIWPRLMTRPSGRRGEAEVRLAIRSGSPVDRCSQGTGLLRLCDQLPGRHRERSDRRCRGQPCDPAGRGGGRSHHDRQGGGSLWPQAKTAGGRHGLWFSCQSRLAGQDKEDHPSHPGDR